jgi:RNA polymerase sigma factor (sigma-70 family)
VIDEPTRGLDEGALRALVPRVLAGLVRRGEDFDAAEDALQEALLEALRVWPEHPPRDPRAWLATVATRRLVDARRSEAARHRREEATYAEPRPAATEAGDDTLFLLFCCCHPDLAPASQVALTLRAVGGLTTREIADAFYVPEATMAQRISRAKRALRGRRLDQPGDLAVVLRVLYLIYTAGHAGRVDLAGEAIRLARQLTLATDEPEARGLLALMLLNHARLPARFDSEGRIVTLDRQDRGLWDTREIAEGVRVLQSALAVQSRCNLVRPRRIRACGQSRPPGAPRIARRLPRTCRWPIAKRRPTTLAVRGDRAHTGQLGRARHGRWSEASRRSGDAIAWPSETAVDRASHQNS